MIIYAPSLSNEHELVTQELGQDQVTLLLNKKLDSIKEITTPVLFTHKPINTNDTIPLLISYSGMLPGIEKQMMQQNSEKIVYLNHKLGK
jgi:hypothetical protein